MDDLGVLIQQYPSLRGDERRRFLAEQLLWIPERAQDPRTVSLCLIIASDPSDYDLARIEVFKWFHFHSFSQASERQAIGEVVQHVLSHEADDDVRGYAAESACRFLDIPGVLEAAMAILSDQAQDSSVRWGAFSIVDTLGPTTQGVAIARFLETDPLFSKTATRLLNEWAVI